MYSLWTKAYIIESWYIVLSLSSFLCFLFLSSLCFPPFFLSSLSLWEACLPQLCVQPPQWGLRAGQAHSWPDIVEPVDRRMEGRPPRPLPLQTCPGVGPDGWASDVCVCVWGGVIAGGDIKGGYSHWSCVNTECMGVFVAWGWGGGRSQQLLAHCNHIVGKLLTFCQAVRLAHRQMLRGRRRAFI